MLCHFNSGYTMPHNGTLYVPTLPVLFLLCHKTVRGKNALPDAYLFLHINVVRFMVEFMPACRHVTQYSS